jgi:hypothetical protein
MMDTLPDLLHEFRRHRALAERAMGDLDDETLCIRPGS